MGDYAVGMAIVKTLHVLGAIFMLGGVSVHLLLRPMAARAEPAARPALYDLAGRIQFAMVYSGSGLLLITGILLWIGRFPFFTGWLLLGLLLYLAAMGLDGAFLAPNLRRLRGAARSGQAPHSADAAAGTIQAVNWLLLLVVVFLMTARPF